jgi:uncharacterized protein involved in tolerance to divalent cations
LEARLPKSRNAHWRDGKINKFGSKASKKVEKLHSYETSCIMKLEVEANKDYADWIKKETK